VSAAGTPTVSEQLVASAPWLSTLRRVQSAPTASRRRTKGAAQPALRSRRAPNALPTKQTRRAVGTRSRECRMENVLRHPPGFCGRRQTGPSAAETSALGLQTAPCVWLKTPTRPGHVLGMFRRQRFLLLCTTRSVTSTELELSTTHCTIPLSHAPLAKTRPARRARPTPTASGWESLSWVKFLSVNVS